MLTKERGERLFGLLAEHRCVTVLHSGFGKAKSQARSTGRYQFILSTFRGSEQPPKPAFSYLLAFPQPDARMIIGEHPSKKL